MVRRWVVICLGVFAALAAVAPESAAQPVPLAPATPTVAAPVREPQGPDAGPEFGLPTDGLMAPAPAVPPRRSYQRPPPGPATAPPVNPDPVEIPFENGIVLPLPEQAARYFRYVPRYGRLNNVSYSKEGDTQRVVITGGVIINVSPGRGLPEIEFATDNAVVWIRGKEVSNVAGFEIEPNGKQEIEVYLAGNVVIRTISTGMNGAITQTLRADEIYYDVARNRAIAIDADLELATPKVPDNVHLTGNEIRRLDLENWEVLDGSAFSSKLPADPGLRFDTPRATLRERRVVRTNIFGFTYRDFQGNPVEGWERLLTVRNAVGRANDVPVFYWPYLRTDVTEPFGPLAGIGLGQDRIFGTQIFTTWDMFKIIARRPPPGHRWQLNLDFLSDRGPAAGTDYSYRLPPVHPGAFDVPRGFVTAYGINDGGVDVLGGSRGKAPTHEAARGRAMWRHQQEILEGMYFQGQIAYLSDQNFFEQYFKNEFDLGPNQESFGYLTYQKRQFWGSGLVQQRLGQDWMTRDNWLPRFDGAVIGQSFFDFLVYNARANAGYAQLRPSEVTPLPVLPTDVRTDSGRFDLNQELSAPFGLGPVKLAPYGVLDLTYYSRDLTGNDRGRVYGGGGLRGNLPLSRLYAGAASELFNIRGLYHKVTIGGNYYYAESDTPYTRLPQFDRLNDDVIDYTYRYIRPAQPALVSGPAGIALATSPLFDQQRYAIRRLVDNRVDTLDDIQVLQMDVRQRLQTKRGYPGLEHTVDVATFDVSASYFPNADRDNFGKPFAFLEYNGMWNVGDRVALLSSGWFDPFDFGARYWNVGASLDRPDRTNFYLGYRQTDPINSKAVTATLGYQLSRRYFTNLGVSYDFGIQKALTNTLSLTRTGSDLTVVIGITYNALVNNFGVQFLVVPNLLAFSGGTPMGFGGMGGQGLRGR